MRTFEIGTTSSIGVCVAFPPSLLTGATAATLATVRDTLERTNIETKSGACGSLHQFSDA